MSSEIADFTAEDFQARTGVDDRAMSRLCAYDSELCRVNAIHNLVARSTMPARWHRHFLDSAQLVNHIPDTAKTLLDIGSGAGFPGLVLAAMLADRQCHITMVESVGKKAQFLEDTAQTMGLSNVTVINERVELINITPPPDIVMARALAALDKLLGYAYPHCGPQTVLVLPKGAKADDELTAARKSWHMEAEHHPSLTSDDAQILKISRLRARGQPRPSLSNTRKFAKARSARRNNRQSGT